MPRSHLLHNQWRILLAALAIALLVCTGFQADAQQRRRRTPAKPQQTNSNSDAPATTPSPQQKKKSLAALRTGETPEGGRATITSDVPLNDYEAYRSGNRYYVVIPGANAPSVPGNARGRGFDDVQVHKRGNDTVLSFRLKPGATAHVNQKFNKLDVVFNSPADAASGAQSGTANTSAGTAGTPTGNGNANSQRPGTETATATPKPPNTTSVTGPIAGNSPTTGPTPLTAAGASTSPSPLTTEPGLSTSLPPVTPALGPTVETPATASPTPPTDQIAQAQPAPSVPNAVTTTPAASGSSLGAVLKSNWLLILIAALVLLSLGLVAMTRSRRKGAEDGERERISDKEAPALEGGKELASATRLEAASVAATAAVVAAEPVDALAQPVAATDETEQETVEAEAPEAFNVERVRLEIKHVLTGEPYDEAIINAPFSETRQLIESELLFALSRRNTERRHRALKAFTEHGYFDDATRDLRTAAVPAERAAAARKLGLTRDAASTPHLVAALDDSAPEVRRAAVEALAELQDQSAIAPLESLLEREEDRKVPHALIQRAIRASATGAIEQEERPAAKTAEPVSTAEVVSEEATTVEASPVETAPVESELVESLPVESASVEAAPVSAEEVATPIAETADMSMAVAPLASGVVEESMVSAPEAPAPAVEETATLKAEPAHAGVEETAPAEETSGLSAASLAIAPAIVTGLVTAEAKASERRRAEADAARIHAEQEVERQAAEEERRRAEEEEEALQRRVEEAARLRAEAETQRLAEETRQREEEQERRRLEEERLRLEQERLRAEEEQRRVEAERLAAEERQRAEEQQRLEQERLRVEKEQRRAEEERLRAEEEQRRAEEEQRRVEAEAERQREEEAAARQREAEERQRAEEEEHRRVALERERQEEEERLRVGGDERQRSEEARRQRAEEREKRRAEEERARIGAEERERSEADAARRRAEDAALRLAEMRRRMEEEARQREEAEAERLRVEEEARQHAEEEAARQLAEEEEESARQQQQEEEERQRVEAEAERHREEEEAARQREEESRLRAEEESRRYAEEERKRVEEESRQRAEAEAARIEFEREAAERRLLEEAESTRIEPEEIEPAYVETTPAVVQSDLFEATFTENASPAHADEVIAEAVVAAPTAPDWIDVDINDTETAYDEPPAVNAYPAYDEEMVTAEADEETAPVRMIEESMADTSTKEIDVAVMERGIAPADDDFATVPSRILQRLSSEVASDREAAVSDLARVGGEDAFREISAAFDDPVQMVRDAAARALFNLNDDHAASFTRALREAPADRRRRIGGALASSGLANQAIGHLMGESREKTYDAFSLLFLMSKAGEVQPLMRAIEEHPNSEVRLAVVKLLALSGQQDILPAFRRLAVRGSLPTEVRSAVMEAIYQISSQTSADTTHVA